MDADVPGLDDEFAVGEVRVVPALLAHLDVLHADRHGGRVPRVAVVRLAPEIAGNVSSSFLQTFFCFALFMRVDVVFTFGVARRSTCGTCSCPHI